MKSAFPTAGCLVWLVVFAVSAAIGALVWPYTINHWLVYAGKPPTVQWWQGALIGFCPLVGQLGIPAAVVTWIVFLFLWASATNSLNASGFTQLMR